jgi:glutathione S-transferase
LGFPKYEQLLPSSFLPALESKAPAFWKWASAVVREKSVAAIWDEKAVAEGTIAKFAKAAAAK